MFTHILVPLDGSGMAESALPAAAMLAEKLAARVTLAHVIEKNAPRQVHGEAHLSDFSGAREYLERIAGQYFSAAVQVDCHVHETEVENVAASIIEHAGELEHDLVIMCSHGRGMTLRLFMGSIAQKVIAGGTCPVLVTHPGQADTAGKFLCRSILVPLDGNPEHAQSLNASRELARACGASLHLAMVVPRLSSLSGNMKAAGRMLPGTTARLLELELRENERYADTLAKQLWEEGFDASAHVLRGDPASTIVEAAREAGVDLIVMATHGKSGLEAFWAGSVTNKICSYRATPLLLVPVTRD